MIARAAMALLLPASLLANPQQVNLTGQSGSFSFPSQAPYSALASWRLEFRFTVTTPSFSSYANLWNIGGWGGFWMRLYNDRGSTLLQVNDYLDPVNGCQFGLPVTVNRDTVGRLTRNSPSGLISLELWSVTGSGYQIVTGNCTAPFVPGLTGTGALGDSQSIGSVAFLRLYSTILPLGSNPPSGPSGGDLGDWEFNGNGKDSSSHHNDISFSPTPTYSAAPIYPPACLMPPQTTFRAGTTAAIASTSFALDGGNALTYSWRQISGPSVLQIGNSTASQVTLDGMIFGSYVIQQTVTDSHNQSTSCSTKYGAVAADANGSVIISNPVHAQILGPIIASYANPWPAYESQGNAFANLMIQKLAGTSPYDFQFVDYWNYAEAGTISVSNGSHTVTGVGTSFTTKFCQGPANPTVPIDGGTSIVIWYPIASSFGLPAGTTGRRIGAVTSCSDDTHLTANFPTASNAWTSDTYVLDGSGLSYAYVESGGYGSTPHGIGGWQTGAYPGNYYDNVEAFYARYYATGIDDYLAAARTLADRWWAYPGIDKGVTYETTQGSPWGSVALQYRSLSLTGLFMRNADNPPYDYWPGLRTLTNYLIGIQSPPNSCSRIGPVPPYSSYGTPVNICGFDLREQGYADTYVAFDALFDTNPTQAAAAQQALSLEMQNRWIPQQQAAGEWLENEPSNSSQNAGFTVTATNGSSTVTVQSGYSWPNGAFAAGPYSASNPPSSFWINSSGTNPLYSNSQGDTDWYYACLGANPSTQITLCDVNGNPVNYAGTGGSGLGWQVGGLTGFGNQPYQVGIQNRAFYFISQALAGYDPPSAASAAQFTLSNAYWIATTGFNSTNKGLYYGRVFPNCEPPSKAYSFCDSGLLGDRELNGEGMNVAIAAYALNFATFGQSSDGSKANAIRLLGDAMMSAMYSVPGDASAPGYDGTNILGDQYPNGYQYTGNGQHKWFGFYWGIGGGWSWASTRLGGVTPPAPRTIQVSPDFQVSSLDVLTVTRPDGSSSQVNCTSSPCSVVIDSRQGDHLLLTRYFDAAGNVVKPPQQVIIKLQ